jgi:hypothetical protein
LSDAIELLRAHGYTVQISESSPGQVLRPCPP